MKAQKETYTKPELVAHAPLRDLTANASHHNENANVANCNAIFTPDCD